VVFGVLAVSLLIRGSGVQVLGLPTIRIIITGIPVFSYSYSAGPSLFEHEYHFIEYEYEGSQKVVGKPKVQVPAPSLC
jgi:hypothetical protein